MDGLENPESTYEIIYVAPPGNGSGGSGTKSDPYQNLKTTLDEALAGQKIYLAPGEYRPNTNLSISAGGSFGRPIYLKTDPELFNASEGRVAVINFENKNLHSALSIHGSYVVIEDIEISNVIGTAVDVFGHWVIIRNNSIHDVNPSGGNNHAGIRIHKPMPWSHQDYANPGQPPKTGKI
jgi:hypothetical protein